MLTADVARRIAINIARLPELLGAGESTEQAMQQMLARSVYCQIAATAVQKAVAAVQKQNSILCGNQRKQPPSMKIFRFWCQTVVEAPTFF